MAALPKSVSGSDDQTGHAGGVSVYQKYGAEHMRRIGAKGAAAVRAKYGLHYYSEIGYRKAGRKHKEPTAA
jgi:hypothetical protein